MDADEALKVGVRRRLKTGEHPVEAVGDLSLGGQLQAALEQQVGRLPVRHPLSVPRGIAGLARLDLFALDLAGAVTGLQREVGGDNGSSQERHDRPHQ